jgi:hypothetical protein
MNLNAEINVNSSGLFWNPESIKILCHHFGCMDFKAFSKIILDA